MKIVEIKEPGGPENLVLAERPIPTPTGSQILIRIAAAGVNRPDVLQRMGLYPPPPGATDIPGLEAAGVVEALGADAVAVNPALKNGARICALLPGGGYGQFAIVDAGACLPVPSGLSMTEAAGLPETTFTVWANIFDDADLRHGETLLVHGATSGIGVMAISLAKAFGARVAATAGTDEKVARAHALGADIAYNYKRDDWENQLAENGGADVVLDMAGGDFVARNLVALNPGGRHVSIAFLRGVSADVNVMTIMGKRLRLSGSTMKARDIREKARLARAIQDAVWPKIEAGVVKPVVDQVFALEDAAAAHRRMEAGDHVGKITLSVDPTIT